MGYLKMKVKELRKECKNRGLKGYSKLKKRELVSLLTSDDNKKIRGPAATRAKSPLLRRIQNSRI